MGISLKYKLTMVAAGFAAITGAAGLVLNNENDGDHTNYRSDNGSHEVQVPPHLEPYVVKLMPFAQKIRHSYRVPNAISASTSSLLTSSGVVNSNSNADLYSFLSEQTGVPLNVLDLNGDELMHAVVSRLVTAERSLAAAERRLPTADSVLSLQDGQQ